jgi:hypothetical protein
MRPERVQHALARGVVVRPRAFAEFAGVGQVSFGGQEAVAQLPDGTTANQSGGNPAGVQVVLFIEAFLEGAYRILSDAEVAQSALGLLGPAAFGMNKQRKGGEGFSGLVLLVKEDTFSHW